jgi:cation diffusion facilitator CzcD-associated flavoprotein CzcO
MASARDETMAPAASAPGSPVADGADIGVAILGAGFAGICMAVKLLEAGREDFLIFEKAAGVGGTWRDNTYPGCACDVPAHLYSYSFAQNPHWSRTYATQPEILAYLEGIAARADVHRRIAFSTPIASLTWDETAARWRLATADGRTFTARVVVSAVGALHVPRLPNLPGMHRFEGDAFHSARWRHDVDLAGRKVAVIGTGASAIQFIPEIAPLVGSLTIFQRSAPWVMPRRDRPLSRLARMLLTWVPGLLRLRRAAQYWQAEIVALGFAYKPKFVGRGQKRAHDHLEKSIPGRLLRRIVMPQYTLGCKRTLKSDDYYPTLRRANVRIVTRHITEVRPRSLVTGDGREWPCDLIIHATGFKPFNPAAGMRIRGRGGRLLADDWRDGPEAFRGVAVAGYPNYFMLMGPNTGLGHNSIVFMIEAQVRYVLQCLRWLDQRLLDVVEVRPEVQRDYNATLQQRFERTVWRSTRGSAWQLPCSSWYAPGGGKNTALWPGFSAAYWLAMRRADIADYVPAGMPAGTAPASAVADAARAA